MRRFGHPVLGLLALAAPAAAWSANARAIFETAGTPQGFAGLASEREVLVDVYFGGRKIGEARALARPGSFQFRSARDLLSMLPQAIASGELAAALASALPSHGDLVCSSGNAGDCGLLSPETVGIIYDEDRFRVDLFVNPRFLRTEQSVAEGYLPAPTAPIGLTSSIGIAVSGSSSSSTAYNVQNRTVLGWRNARIRVNSSLASGTGLLFDDFVGELEHKDLRYSAGLFWAPGNDFTGQRRIIGAGVGTQFDTWADRDSLHGTPLVVFLAQPARVELLVDGRLISSRSYSAGNVALDTAALPNGSYNVLIRVHQANGRLLEERRFFAKNMQAPPVGHPIFYGFAGMLANSRRGDPISLSHSFFYQVGGAWRLNSGFALDVSAAGTQHKAMIEAGAWVLKRVARVRAAALVSSAGDAGALLQLSSGGQGPLNFNLDLRRIWSRDGGPLIPLPTYADTFGTTPPTGFQLANGSYTQATGSIGLRLGAGYMAIVGSYRRDDRLPADYSIGPSVNWPLLVRGRLQLVLDASAQRTRTTTAAFAGVRALFTSGGFSMLGRLGHGSQSERDGTRASESRIVGELSAQYSREDGNRNLVELEAGAARNIDSSTAHAAGALYSRFGNVRADLLHNLEGSGGTQYGLTLQSGVALTSNALALSGRDLDQSALLISVAGDAPSAEFNVLVDDVVRGQVKVGQRFSLFVPGYRSYKVRLVPTADSHVRYDAGMREVTLYPGNVQRLAWRADSYFTLFAQAVSPDGHPIANALVQTEKSVGETDANGYFQIDTRHDEPIAIAAGGNSSCTIRLPQVAVKADFASLGKVICQ